MSGRPGSALAALLYLVLACFGGGRAAAALIDGPSGEADSGVAISGAEVSAVQATQPVVPGPVPAAVVVDLPRFTAVQLRLTRPEVVQAVVTSVLRCGAAGGPRAP